MSKFGHFSYTKRVLEVLVAKHNYYISIGQKTKIIFSQNYDFGNNTL